MKSILIIFCLSIAILSEKLTAQQCLSNEQDILISEILSQMPGIDFYQESDCTPFYLNCNFVFLRRDDGTGSFLENRPAIDQIISGINSRLASIKDNDNCSPNLDYPYDSKIRLKVNIDSIDNTLAWDWYTRAISMNDYFDKAFCPGEVLSQNSSWPNLKSEIINYCQSHPNAVNYFFVENGVHLAALDQALSSGNSTNLPWHADPDPGIFAGCSAGDLDYNAGGYHVNIMINQWTNYLLRLEFGELYFPNANESNEVLAGWHIEEAQVLDIHELGHMIIGGHTCGCKNYMDGDGCTPSWEPGMSYLLQAQLRAIPLKLMATNMHNVVSCEDLDNYNCDVIATGSAEIKMPLSIFGDLIISEGSTLTISSDIYFSPLSRILVQPNAKLIVINGLLTNGCGDTWKGIKVTSPVESTLDFNVVLLGSIAGPTIVENTSEAAISMFAPVPWPEIQEFGNGKLRASNCEFKNTKRIVEFMSWKPLMNSSIITNCKQIGGTYGITNWNCTGITVKDNIFNNVEKECIVTVTGQFKIEGNKFFGGQTSILLSNVAPGIGTIVKDNEFNEEFTGIRCLGTANSVHQITANKFNDGIFDIYMDGLNKYIIADNIITSNVGVACVNNGGYPNIIKANNLDGSVVGILANSNNDNFTFYENCFNTTQIDAYIDGQIGAIQSKSISEAANNCFSHLGNPLSSVKDIAGNPSQITYIEPGDNIVNCLDAVKAHPNVAIVENFSAFNPCVLFPVPQPYSDCFLPDSEIEIINIIDSLSLAIHNVENDTLITIETKNWFAAVINKCKKNAIWKLFDLYLNTNQYLIARNLIKNENTEESMIALYSSYIWQNEIDSAKYFLEQIELPSSEFKDFIKIQNYYLNYLNYGPYYIVDQQILDTVLNIANKPHIYAGFGKSLYYLFTGEIISSELPIDFDEIIVPRSTTSIDNEIFEVSPNPFSDYLSLKKVIMNSRMNSYRICNIYGRVVSSGLLPIEININTANWEIGIYIVTFLYENEIISTKKIVLIK